RARCPNSAELPAPVLLECKPKTGVPCDDRTTRNSGAVRQTSTPGNSSVCMGSDVGSASPEWPAICPPIDPPTSALHPQVIRSCASLCVAQNTHAFNQKSRAKIAPAENSKNAGSTGLSWDLRQKLDYRTLQKSGPLPLAFLRGVGLPDMLIDYLPSLLNQAIQHYSCFISYSTKDQEFAERLYADLQDKRVRCWFAPHDLRIGKKILDAVDAAIRLRDRVLLTLSEHSINSGWVEDEVTAAFEEERKRRQEVLFPIRLDDAVIKTKEAWAAKLRARLIGDFRQWKDHDAYQ